MVTIGLRDTKTFVDLINAMFMIHHEHLFIFKEDSIETMAFDVEYATLMNVIIDEDFFDKYQPDATSNNVEFMINVEDVKKIVDRIKEDDYLEMHFLKDREVYTITLSNKEFGRRVYKIPISYIQVK